ncbi:hypothetical protein MIND_01281000 [Mycena indigotica]|uniref:F-box domain-containing protein n=1 Tax=Mycena indigotica TaxID=2126181 RepID=A0A8H6S135_9AGAR|nr:uncharacterized protein MIND_01281000 [Mycena indigotica]KAF7291365.1 hypothetical protein MIND_01281000 [Mycena indigotica]
MSTGTNDAPAQLRRKLAEIDANIDNMRASLTAAYAARRCIIACLRQVTYAGILSVPMELTAEFFGHCVEEFTIGGRSPSDTGTSPLVLAAVCSEWRRIAVGLPRIWSRIGLRQAKLSDKQARLLELCLARSRGHSLEVSSYSLTAEVPLQTYGAIGRLEAYTGALADTLQLGTEKLSCLQSLTLQGISPLPTQEPLDTFADTPALRHVHLASVSLAQIVLPWAQITSFTVSYIRLLALYDFLRNMPQLQTLDVHMQRPTLSDQTVRPAPLSLALLHTLRINEQYFVYDYSWTQELTVPALAHLHLGRWDSNGDSETYLDDLLKRSKCTLLSLVVDSLVTHPGLLEWTPALTHLTVHNTSFEIAKGLLESIIDPVRRGSSLPRLCSLHITPELDELPLVHVANWYNRCRVAARAESASESLRDITIVLPWHPSEPAEEARRVQAILDLRNAAGNAETHAQFSFAIPGFYLSSHMSPIGNFVDVDDEWIYTV